MVFGGGILGGARKKRGNPYLNSTTVLFDSSDEGRDSHFASSLDWSKSLDSFSLTTSDESVANSSPWL